jgi:hypothetical protein
MCQMCWMHEEPERSGEQDLTGILDRIREYGWSVQGAPGPGSRPHWAYTAGLTAQGQPELVVTGLQPPQAARLLNIAADQAWRTGPPEPGEHWALPGLPLLEAVPLSSPAEHLPVAVSCYGREIRATQLVHADAAGIFPWSAAYHFGLGGQPVLGVRHG